MKLEQEGVIYFFPKQTETVAYILCFSVAEMECEIEAGGRHVLSIRNTLGKKAVQQYKASWTPGYRSCSADTEKHGVQQ